MFKNMYLSKHTYVSIIFSGPTKHLFTSKKLENTLTVIAKSYLPGTIDSNSMDNKHMLNSKSVLFGVVQNEAVTLSTHDQGNSNNLLKKN